MNKRYHTIKIKAMPDIMETGVVFEEANDEDEEVDSYCAFIQATMSVV